MTPLPEKSYDAGVLDAVAYCRVPRATPRPAKDRSFADAEALGLLSHHGTWHATREGEGLLIAFGMLPPAPAPPPVHYVVLWAVTARWSTPQFVAAYADGLVDSFPESYERRRAEDEQWYRDFFDPGDSVGLRFWTTNEELPQPEVPNAGE